MTLTDKLMIFALFAGPIAAVQVQKLIEMRTVKRTKKKQVFFQLMTTRGLTVSPEHIQALNSIDICFDGDRNVTVAWKALLDHFATNYPKDDDPNLSIKLTQCGEKAKELLADLLYEMGCSLGYKFDRVHLKRNVYVPRGQAEFLMEGEAIRKAFLDILNGKKSLPVKVIN